MNGPTYYVTAAAQCPAHQHRGECPRPDNEASTVADFGEPHMILASPSPLLLKAGSSGDFAGVAWAYATTPDSAGDVITEAALVRASKGVPLPLLINHAGDPVGEIRRAGVTAQGLTVEGVIDTASEAYAKARSGELPALSIGFLGRAEKAGPLRVFHEIELAEVSLTAAPVNTGSRVTAIKAWNELTSERELVALLKSATSMPGRLAQKIAAAAWPHVQHPENEPDPALIAALRQFARI